jgi:hypothetical protein
MSPCIAAILAALKETQGVLAVTGPSVVTTYGNRAHVSVTQAKTTEGTTHHLGPVIGVTPHLLADGSSVELDVDVAATVETQSLRGP